MSHRVAAGVAQTHTEKTGGEAGLLRGLGVVDATTLVAGAVIGSGIFLVPSLVARQVGAPGLSLMVWLVCGFLATAGALCFAELGAAIPRTGGTYAFLYRAFGTPLLPFLFGWSMFFVVLTGVMAAVATAFATYAGFFLEGVVPYGEWTQRIVAIGCILFLTVMNCIGVRVGGKIQVAFTVVKIGGVAALILPGLWLGADGGGSLSPMLPAQPPAAGTLAAFGTAMIVALFAYNGWWYVTFVAGELREPRRAIPRSILAGMAIVLTVYILANIVYLTVLPFDELRASSRPAADAMQVLVGPAGAALVSAAVMLSAFGTVNAQLLGVPRIYYAMARDRLFFSAIARVHPRFRTPAAAILAQGLWAAGLALTGSYQQIITFTAFPNYVFLNLAVVGLIVLRIREPELHRPYRVWGYPVTPVLFLLIFAWYLINSLLSTFTETMVGIVLTLSGLPFYFYWARKRDTPTAAAADAR